MNRYPSVIYFTLHRNIIMLHLILDVELNGILFFHTLNYSLLRVGSLIFSIFGPTFRSKNRVPRLAFEIYSVA